MLRQRNCIEDSRVTQCYTSSSFFIFLQFSSYYTSVAFLPVNTVNTFVAVCHSLRHGGRRKPRRWLQIADEAVHLTAMGRSNWCQSNDVLQIIIQITFKSVQLKTQSKIWMMEEQVWGNPIRDKLQNVSKCCKSIQICTFGRKSQGGRVLLSCICQIFSAFLSDFWGGIPRTMWHVATAKSTATWNHQFSQQLVSDKTLSTQRGQS